MTMLSRSFGFLLAVSMIATPALAQTKGEKKPGADIKTYSLPDSGAPKAGTTDVLGDGKPKGPAKPMGIKAIAARPERMADEKLELAIVTLNQLIETTDDDDPGKPEYYARLARLYWDKAENFFNKAYGNEMFNRLKKAQDTGDEAGVAQVQAEQQELIKQRVNWQEETANAYMMVVDRYPNYINLDQVLYLLGYTLVQMDRQDQAFPYFARVIREAPNSKYVPDALLNIGEFYFNSGRMDEAQKMYAEVENFPVSSAYGLAIYKKGWCFYNMGQHEEAMNQFLKVIDYAKGDQAKSIGYGTQLLRESQRDLVMVYSQVGSPENAIKVFKAIAPTGYMELAVRLAEGYASQGEYDKSTKLFKKIIAEYKDAQDQYKIVEYQRAILENVYKLAAKARVVEEARRLIGLLDKYQKEAPKAFIDPEMQKAEELVRVIATNYQKEVLVTKEEATKEFTHLLYNEYLRLFPNSPEYYMMTYNYAQLLFELKKYDEAASRFTTIVELQPNGPVALDAAHMSVSAYYNLIDLSKTKTKSDDSNDTEAKELPEFETRLVKACERYLAMATKDAADVVEARFAAAMVWYQYNHFDKAEAGFRTIIEDFPTNANAPAAARLLLSSLTLQRNIKGLYAATELVAKNPNLMQGDVPGIITRINEQKDFNKCYEFEQAARYPVAAECFLKYVKDFPGTPLKDRSLINAANNFFKARLVERSLKANEQLVNEMPDSPLAIRALYNIADTYRRLAVYSEAARIYEVFVGLQPSHELTEEALRYATIFRSGLGEHDAAIKDLRKYLTLFPKAAYTISVALEIGNSLEKQGKHALAQKEYEGWLAKYGKSSLDLYLKAHLRIGLALRAQKKEGPALDWFKKTVKAYEDLTDEEKAKVTAVGLAAAAEAQFYKGEAVLADVRAVQLKLPEKVLAEAIAKKIGLIKEAMDLLTNVEAFGQPNWTIASQSRKGAGFQELAEAIENSPVPPALNPDQKLFFKQGLADKAAPIWERARESYRRCVDLAQQLKWYNNYSAQAEEQLLRLDPEFKTLPDIRPQPGYYTMNEGRATLKAEKEGAEAPKWTDGNLDPRVREAAAAPGATAQALYNLGAVLAFQGDRAGARAAYEKSLAKDAQSADALAQLGRLDLLDGRSPDAVAKFDKALQIDAANSIANNYYAAKALRDRNFPEAINLARKALVSDPDSMDAYDVLAATYLEMGLTDVGVLVGRNALGLSPNDGPIQNLLGLTFLKTGEVRQAVQLFQKAVRDDPRLFDARMNFGAVTLAYKDATTALEQFAEAVRLRPANVEARLGQAVALRGLGKGEDALRILTDIARDPNNADVRFNLCLVYQENLNKLELAGSECDAFLRLGAASHPKRKEASRRLEAIRLEIEAGKAPAPMPVPAPAPAPAPAPTPGTAPTADPK